MQIDDNRKTPIEYSRVVESMNYYELLISILKDPERKPIVKMVWELVYLSFHFKRIPRHYFSRFLYKNDRTNILDYFPNDIIHDLKLVFNRQQFVESLENKLLFDFYFRQFNIRLPEILVYNHRNKFIIGSRCIDVKNAKEFRDLLVNLAKEKNVTDAFFIKKTYWSYGGEQVHKLGLEEIEIGGESIDSLYDEIIKSGYLFQRVIKQHPVMDQLNPHCVNTIRIDTFLDNQGKVETISGHIRTSTSNLHVDNLGLGGCGVSVDLQTGKLKQFGFIDIRDGGVLEVHPLTKVVFKDFKIPFVEEAKQLVIQAAQCIPALRLVGWDVAIGENGPILIEGNSDYDITGNDLHYGGYLTNPVFRKVLKEANYRGVA